MNKELVVDKELYNQMWSGQCNDMRTYGPTTRHELRILKNLINEIDYETVLDIGCGIGNLLDDISNMNPAAKLSGLDISDKSVEICKQRFQSEDFWVMDCSKEHLNKQFDLILCIDVIEHIENDQAFLDNIAKMLKGKLIIATLEGKMRRNEIDIGHCRNYQKGELESMARQSGLKLVKKINWGFPFFSPIYRDIVEKGSVQNIAYGSYGFGKKLLAQIIYTVFCFNLHNKGDLVFLVLEPEA